MLTVCYINRMNVQIPYTDGYKDSAEPREKRIAELEKKNRELEDRLCNVANYLLDSWCRNKDDYCPHLAKLEKENAELKTKVTALENANRAMVKELDDTTSGGLNILQNVVKNKEELATAKEIINDLVHLGEFNEHTNEEYFNYQVHEALKNAEQFLKDSEVEKCLI